MAKMEEPVYAVVKKERRKPVKSNFLVSFLVDSRGAALTGCRKSGLRLLVPPNAVSKPTRVVLRYVSLKSGSSSVSSSEVWLPPLGDLGCLATGVLELSSSPSPMHTELPLLLELPHFLAETSKSSLVLLQSKDGQRWTERGVVGDQEWQGEEQRLYEDVCQQAELQSAVLELSSQRIIRTSLLGQLPRYLTVMARPPLITASLDAAGRVLSHVSDRWQVQLAFPREAVSKRIKAALQLIKTDDSYCWIRVLPKDKKFHKPISCVVKMLDRKENKALKNDLNETEGDSSKKEHKSDNKSNKKEPNDDVKMESTNNGGPWVLVRFGSGKPRLLSKDEYEYSCCNEICVASKTSMELCINLVNSEWPKLSISYASRLRAFFRPFYPHAWCDCLKIYFESNYNSQGCSENRLREWQGVLESDELQIRDNCQVQLALKGDWSVANYSEEAFLPTQATFRALNEEPTHVVLLLKRRVKDANNASLQLTMDCKSHKSKFMQWQISCDVTK